MAAPPVADDNSEAVRVARNLWRAGACRGAFQIAINAAAQPQAAKAGDPAQGLALGIVPQAKPHFDAANDHLSASNQPGGTVA